MQNSQEEKEIRNTWDIWNPIARCYEPTKKEFSEREKHAIRQKWCDMIVGCFETYKDDHEMPILRTPYYTANVMAKIGLLDKTEIDHKEIRNNIREDSNESLNGGLVQKCFDAVIERDEHLNDFLIDFRGEFNPEMPF